MPSPNINLPHNPTTEERLSHCRFIDPLIINNEESVLMMPETQDQNVLPAVITLLCQYSGKFFNGGVIV